jgi:hypothetical protein
MRVTLTRSGGVAGVRLQCCVDSDKLSARDTARLRKLLAAANLPAHCSHDTGTRMPDALHYTLATTDGELQQSFQFGEDVPEAVSALVSWLRRKAVG